MDASFSHFSSQTDWTDLYSIVLCAQYLTLDFPHWLKAAESLAFTSSYWRDSIRSSASFPQTRCTLWVKRLHFFTISSEHNIEQYLRNHQISEISELQSLDIYRPGKIHLREEREWATVLKILHRYTLRCSFTDSQALSSTVKQVLGSNLDTW